LVSYEDENKMDILIPVFIIITKNIECYLFPYSYIINAITLYQNKTNLKNKNLFVIPIYKTIEFSLINYKFK